MLHRAGGKGAWQALAVAGLLVAGQVQAGTLMKVNELQVFRDGDVSNWLQGQNQILLDDFDNGNPLLGPNFASGDAATYTALGASNPLTVGESGGQLLLDAALADPSAGATGSIGRSVRVRLNTNVADPNRGLPLSRSFAVIANLALDALPDRNAQFGLRLNDSFSDTSDLVELSLVHRASGYGVLFRKQDFLGHTINDYDFEALTLPSTASGLLLALVHPLAGSNNIGAAYGFTNASGELIGNLQPLDAIGTAFNGELHTRVELRATAPVPEPGTWALMLGGLAALATTTRARQRR